MKRGLWLLGLGVLISLIAGLVRAIPRFQAQQAETEKRATAKPSADRTYLSQNPRPSSTELEAFKNRLVATAGNPQSRMMLQKELLAMGEGAAPALEACLRAPDPLTQKQACWAASLLSANMVKLPSLRPALSECLKSPEPDIRLNAVKTLGLQGIIGEKEALLLLKPLLEDPVPDIRLYAARYLGAIDRSAIPVLIALTQDGRHATLAVSYLRELTGKTFKTHAEWQGWWAQQPQAEGR